MVMGKYYILSKISYSKCLSRVYGLLLQNFGLIHLSFHLPYLFFLLPLSLLPPLLPSVSFLSPSPSSFLLLPSLLPLLPFALISRYELPQPSAAQKNDVGAWQESVENSMAQLEHQAGRWGRVCVCV